MKNIDKCSEENEYLWISSNARLAVTGKIQQSKIYDQREKDHRQEGNGNIIV